MWAKIGPDIKKKLTKNETIRPKLDQKIYKLFQKYAKTEPVVTKNIQNWIKLDQKWIKIIELQQKFDQKLSEQKAEQTGPKNIKSERK